MNDVVARHVRAWIETPKPSLTEWIQLVARHVRAWIETCQTHIITMAGKVARHVRAWIETIDKTGSNVIVQSRTPCACAD